MILPCVSMDVKTWQDVSGCFGAILLVGDRFVSPLWNLSFWPMFFIIALSCFGFFVSESRIL